MRRRSLARWLVVGALALFSSFLFSGLASADEAETAGSGEAQAESTSGSSSGSGDSSASGSSSGSGSGSSGGSGTLVQGQNGSSGGAAASGSSTGSNSANVSSGPSSSSSSGSSQSQQLGNNSTTVKQTSSAKSGDAVAGSQVTGVVGGNATVQNQNSSSNSAAVSGPASASNEANVSSGPSSNSTGGSAQAAQAGNNRVNASQSSSAESGDAVAGSQSTGTVGSGSTVQNQNSSDNALALSGGACASAACGAGNSLLVGAGPTATSGANVGANAQAGQLGGNNVVISQASAARSGDALAGSQVTGGVGTGNATVMNQNSSTNSLALSGPAFATNVAAVTAGPSASAAGLIGSSAQSSQAGGNTVILDQDSQAYSGDAVAGGQVTGLVSSERGNLSVLNQQSSDSSFAISGIAAAGNVGLVNAGPVAGALGGTANASQIGGNAVVASQSSNAQSGDALAGSGVTGIVGGSNATVMNQQDSQFAVALSGPALAGNVLGVNAGPTAVSVPLIGAATANASQFGNNTVLANQAANAVSGDALAGSQVTGLAGVGRGTVMNQNSSDAAFSFSGPAVSGNAAAVLAGPQAFAVSPFLGNATANASQAGSNVVGLDQASAAVSGDALAGSQVTGVVGRGGVTVMNQNNANLSVSASGPAISANTAFVTAGPEAFAFAGFLGNATAQASQAGNNVADVAQRSLTASGDALSGSQVTGVVTAGGQVVVQNQNTSNLSFAFSGPAFGLNNVTAALGPSVTATAGFLGNATGQASQFGNNRLGLSQDLASSSGDAVAGSQVTGLVGAGLGSVVSGQNTSAIALALSGFVTGNNDAGGTLGPAATVDALLGSSNASTQQAGGSSLNAGQGLDLNSGDSVVGSQVVGKVGL